MPGHVNTSEGGFLSGRNPFTFVESAPLPTFIIQLLVIICLCKLVKLILTPIRQPSVIAEIIAGIILGPTALSSFPEFKNTVFPAKSLPFLGLMANFGLVLFLFLVGLELDPTLLKSSFRRSFAISLAGMALPFAGGVGASYALYSYVEPANHATGFVTYLLFLGVAMAITAFPVLARILTELNILQTKVGSITISAAAVDDATSWCLLALVISLINAGSGFIAIYVFLIGLGYSLFLVLGLRPLFVYFLRRQGALEGNEPSQLVMFFTLVLVFVSAFITDAIGIHAIFGGFIAGIIIPHEGSFAYHVSHKIEDIVNVLLLPLYFTLSGLKTKIGSLNDPISWAMVVFVILVACSGKIIGCTLAARATKMNWRESLTVGFLMNCKGLVELIVLNLGYDAGVISDKTFAIMVIMALVTTFLTVPVVSYIYPLEFQDTPEILHDPNSPNDPRKTSHTMEHHKVLVNVSKIDQVPSVLGIVQILYGEEIKQDSEIESKLKDSKSIGITLPRLDQRPILNVLRMTEMSERNSSVILTHALNSMQSQEDPVMNMFEAFDAIVPINVEGISKIVAIRQFAKTVLSTATDVGASRILVPWVGNSLPGPSPNPVNGTSGLLTERRLSVHRASMFSMVQNSQFIRDLLKKGKNHKSTIMVLVDRGIGSLRANDDNEDDIRPKFSICRKIYLPFFGGPDDRAALTIAVNMAAQSPQIEVEIMRFQNFNFKKNAHGGEGSIKQSPSAIFNNPSNYAQSETGSTNSMVNKDSMGGGGNTEILVSDTADELMLVNLFGNPPPNSQIVVNSNLRYTVIESFSPVTSAINLIKNMEKDLIVVGRGIPIKRGGLYGEIGVGVDSERRRVLGDLSESILQTICTSSLLVVQAGKR